MCCSVNLTESDGTYAKATLYSSVYSPVQLFRGQSIHTIHTHTHHTICIFFTLWTFFAFYLWISNHFSASESEATAPPSLPSHPIAAILFCVPMHRRSVHDAPQSLIGNALRARRCVCSCRSCRVRKLLKETGCPLKWHWRLRWGWVNLTFQHP